MTIQSLFEEYKIHRIVLWTEETLTVSLGCLNEEDEMIILPVAESLRLEQLIQFFIDDNKINGKTIFDYLASRGVLYLNKEKELTYTGDVYYNGEMVPFSSKWLAN